jgi:hypothetical protein
MASITPVTNVDFWNKFLKRSLHKFFVTDVKEPVTNVKPIGNGLVKSVTDQCPISNELLKFVTDRCRIGNGL